MQNQPNHNPLNRRVFLGGAGAVTAAAAATVLIPPTVGAGAESGETRLPASMRAPSALAMKRFSKIDGTPVYYWRNNRGNHDPVAWHCTQAFYDRLVVWLREFRKMSRGAGYGNVRFLVSAGFYVNKPGQHGAGTAMDLDFVKWSSGKSSSPLDKHHVANSLALRRRYLAVDATLRRRFCYVLDGWYPDHHDHFHADFADLPTLLNKGSESATNFVQACGNRFMGAGLAIDGAWGPNTQRAYARMLNKLDVNGDPTGSVEVYRTLLGRIARHGLRNKAF